MIIAMSEGCSSLTPRSPKSLQPSIKARLQAATWGLSGVGVDLYGTKSWLSCLPGTITYAEVYQRGPVGIKEIADDVLHLGPVESLGRGTMKDQQTSRHSL